MMERCGHGAIINSGNWEMELRRLFPATSLRKFQDCQESQPSQRAQITSWHSNPMEQFGRGGLMALVSWESACRTLSHTQHLFRFLVCRMFWVYLLEAMCRTRSSQTA